MLKSLISYLKNSYVILNRNCRCNRYRVLREHSKIFLKNLLINQFFKRKINYFKIFNCKIYCQSIDSFLYSFQEIFILDTYYQSFPNKQPIIIDCGANIGLSVLYFTLTHPKSKIIAIEPDPTTFSTLKRNITNNNIFKNVTCINAAITTQTNKTIPFFINSKIPGALQMSTRKRWSLHQKKIMVKSITLSSIINKQNKGIDLIKMDIEGMETQVTINLMKNKRPKKIKNLIVEYHHHLDPKKANLSKILSSLEKNKYNYQLTTNKVFLPFTKNSFQDIMLFAYKNT